VHTFSFLVAKIGLKETRYKAQGTRKAQDKRGEEGRQEFKEGQGLKNCRRKEYRSIEINSPDTLFALNISCFLVPCTMCLTFVNALSKKAVRICEAITPLFS
jgi:hypothetical protein